MKKLFSIFKGCICLVLCLNTVGGWAQGTKKSSITKLVSTASETSSESSSSSVTGVNDRAIREFKKAYATATGTSWTSTENGFIAIFQESNARSHAYYNKKGRWMGTIRYLHAGAMPESILNQLAFNFPAYHFGIAQELTLPFQLLYLIYIENDRSYKRIKIADGLLEVMEESKK